MTSRRGRLGLLGLLLVLICLAAVEAYGFRSSGLFSQPIWDAAGLKRLIRLAGVFLAGTIPILLLIPWAFAPLLFGAAVVLTAVATGAVPVLAVALLLMSACALGSLISRKDALTSTLIGIAVYIFLMNCLARLPVHYPAVWLIVLAIPLAANWRALPRRLVLPELRTWGERGACAVLAFGLVMHWLVVLKPEQSADGLAMHLAIPADIARHHAFTFQPALVVWSVMPMGADYANAIVYLLGGESAARLLNLSMLLIAAGLLYRAARGLAGPATSLLIAASFVTTPLVQLVTGSLFIENTLAAMILGMMTAVWERRPAYVLAILAGTAISVKIGAFTFVIAALPFAVAGARRSWKSGAVAAVLLLAAASPPYAQAWWKTNNPIFPFKNEKIHSPLIDPSVQFQDNAFRQPLTFRTPYDLTFRTHHWYEAQDGAFGFQYLLLAPAGLLALAMSRRRVAVSAGVVAAAVYVAVMRSEPNARYLYAALPLFLVTVAGLIAWASAEARWAGGMLAGVLAACCLVNIYFLPASGWYHKDFYLTPTFSRRARERYVREVIPVRDVVRQLNRMHPGATVMLTTDNDTADVNGAVYADHWHYFTVIDQLRRATAPADMRRLLERWGVQYFIGRKPGAGDPTDPPELDKFVEACSASEYEAGVFRLRRLLPACAETGR